MLYQSLHILSKTMLFSLLLSLSFSLFSMEKGEEIEPYTTGSSLLEQSLEKFIKKSLTALIQKNSQNSSPEENEISLTILPIELIEYMLEFVEVPSKEFHFLKMYLQKQNSELPQHIKDKLTVYIFFKLFPSTQCRLDLISKQLVDNSQFFKYYFNHQNLEQLLKNLILLQDNFDKIEGRCSSYLFNDPVHQLVMAYSSAKNCYWGLQRLEDLSTQAKVTNKQRAKRQAFFLPSFIMFQGLVGACLYTKLQASKGSLNPTMDLILNVLYDIRIASALLSGPIIYISNILLIKLVLNLVLKKHVNECKLLLPSNTQIKPALTTLSKLDIELLMTYEDELSDDEESNS